MVRYDEVPIISRKGFNTGHFDFGTTEYILVNIVDGDPRCGTAIKQI